MECPYCHAVGQITTTIHFSPVGMRVLSRSKAELEQKDFTLSIILSAMAVECGLASLFFWWKRMDRYISESAKGLCVTPQEETSWEERFRKDYGSIAKKLDGISQLLTNSDFNAFIGESKKTYFEERLFWRRNQIIHFGKLDFGKCDAEECYSLASTLFEIMRKMQEECNNRLQAQLKQNSIG